MSDFENFNEAYAKFDGMSLGQLIGAMEECKSELDELAAKKTEKQKEYDFLRRIKLPKLMEDQGIDKMKPDGGRGVRIQDELFVSVRKENQESLKQWLIENGFEQLIQETVNSSSLKGFINNCIKAGQDYPEDIVKVTLVPTARFY